MLNAEKAKAMTDKSITEEGIHDSVMNIIMQRVVETAGIGKYCLANPFGGCDPYPSPSLQNNIISALKDMGYTWDGLRLYWNVS